MAEKQNAAGYRGDECGNCSCSVLFLNRVFPPLPGATGELLAELSDALAKRGLAITVITSQARSVSLPSTSPKVRVERVGGLAFTRLSHWRRALSYLSLYPAFLWRALRLPRHDIIVTMTDPPLHLLLGAILKKWKGSKLIHWAQDIYPELAIELGVLGRNSMLARFLKSLSTWSLRRHDLIVALGECMKQRLLARGIPAEKIVVVPNWAQNELCDHLEGQRRKDVADRAQMFRRKHGLENKFVVLYSGNFGLAHSFEAILQAVPELEKKLPNARFVFVGDGPQLPMLKDKLSSCANVLFLPFQPKELLHETLAAADLHLVTMQQQLCGLVVPSKVYGILAVSKPCLFIGPKESEAGLLILRERCGWVLPPVCGAELADFLVSVSSQPDLLVEMGHRGGNACASHRADIAASQFLQFFRRLSPNCWSESLS